MTSSKLSHFCSRPRTLSRHWCWLGWLRRRQTWRWESELWGNAVASDLDPSAFTLNRLFSNKHFKARPGLWEQEPSGQGLVLAQLLLLYKCSRKTAARWLNMAASVSRSFLGAYTAHVFSFPMMQDFLGFCLFSEQRTGCLTTNNNRNDTLTHSHTQWRGGER